MEAMRVLAGEIVPVLEVHWITVAEHLHARKALLARIVESRSRRL
jgi:hypothetical protein